MTYDYQQNKFRPETDYPNHWKEEDKLSGKTVELMKALDLDPTWNKEDLLTIMANLNRKVEDLEEREEDWRNQIQKAHDMKYSMQTKTAEFERLLKKLEDDNLKVITAKTLALKQLIKFGGHEHSCAYSEAAACGRILRGEEQKICNCGWYESQKAIKEQLKQ